MSLTPLLNDEFINTVFSSVTDPMRIVDRDFRLLWTNQELVTETSKICYTLFGFDTPCQDCPVVPVFHTGRVNISERQLAGPDGSIRWIEVRAYPVFDNNNEPQMVVTIGRDITDRKKAETVEEAQTKDSVLKLSRRQTEVLKLVAEGRTNIEIASNLSISPHTVKRHVTNLFNILGVNDRTQAAILALKHRLI